MIGQSAGYEVVPASGVGAFLVSVRVGWGDCPAGCINEHTWVYAVSPDGGVTLQSEGGDVVPPDAWPSPGGDGRTGLAIIATAGFDQLTDQGEAYAKALRDAGVTVRYRCYDSLCHAFTAFTGAVPAADAASREIAALVCAAYAETH